MKATDPMTEVELLQMGYTFICIFGCGEIWGRRDSRIMWDRKYQKVILTYESGSRYATCGN